MTFAQTFYLFILPVLIVVIGAAAVAAHSYVSRDHLHPGE